jgi:hypothetical protein
MNDEIAHRKLLIGKVIELRSLVALACQVKCEKENQLKTVDLRRGVGKNKIVLRFDRL